MKKIVFSNILMILIFTFCLLLVGCGETIETKKTINSITANVTTTTDYKYDVNCVISERCEYEATCITNDDLNYATLTITFNSPCNISNDLNFYLYVDNEMVEVNKDFIIKNDNSITYSFVDAYWSKIE